MSTILCLITWNFTIGFLNATRLRAYSIVFSRITSAIETQSMPTTSRSSAKFFMMA